jgi:hypothetical protein
MWGIYTRPAMVKGPVVLEQNHSPSLSSQKTHWQTWHRSNVRELAGTTTAGTWPRAASLTYISNQNMSIVSQIYRLKTGITLRLIIKKGKYAKLYFLRHLLGVWETYSEGISYDGGICALLGYYAASRGNCLPTFRYSISVPSFLLGLLTLWDGTETLSRNVSKQLPHEAA